MKRLIALDIDGTLRDEQYGIPESAKKAISICREKGHIVCLCTGRSIGMIQEDVKALGIDTIIAGGGNYIVHKEAVIKKEAFCEAKMKQLKKYWERWREELPFAITLESDDVIYMNQAAVLVLKEMNQEKKEHLSREQVQYINQNEVIRYEENWNQWKEAPIHKICLWSDKKFFEEMRELLGEEMILAQEGRWKEQFYYEMVKKGCDKGDAILALCEYLKISLEQTIAFGDGNNDSSMLTACQIGIAMENGSEELKKIADGICEEAMKDGIYKELERRKIIE